MNIGYIIPSLRPVSPASARFQELILEGVKRLDPADTHFYVLSESA